MSSSHLHLGYVQIHFVWARHLAIALKEVFETETSRLRQINDK